MKYIALLLIFFTAQFSEAWSCDLNVFDDVSNVDRCYGRILDHWIHESKVTLIKHWQEKRTQNNGTLDKAGGAWSSSTTDFTSVRLQRLLDLKDHLVRDRRHQDFPETLTCESDSEDDE